MSRLGNIIAEGVYAAILRPFTPHRRSTQEATFADYATAQQGDDVFFFSRRKLYGIGSVVDVGRSCVYGNFPNASLPRELDYAQFSRQMFIDNGPESVNQRWLMTFAPRPAFFLQGVDIDDVLASRPSSFRGLRAMENVTFGRVDDEEAQALRDVILRRNEDIVLHGGGEGVFEES